MRKLALLLGFMLALGFAGSALAAEFQFHGDLNNRFMLYTDQAGMFSGAETAKTAGGVIDKDGIDESWAEIKYRLWVEASTNDGKVKGVYAIELGAIRFGDGSTLGGSTKGGAFSGDGINIETRWAYTDFQIPGVASKARVSIGLIPFKVNSFVWEETAMGVQLKGAAATMDYTLAWVRGRESSLNNDTNDDLFEDLDAFLARVDLKPMKNFNLGLFALYQGRDPGSDDIAAFTPATQYQVKLLPAVDLSLYTLGTDGSWTTPTGFGNVFLNWDLVYQGGSLDDNTVSRDVSAYLAHIDLGANFGKTRLTYTTWYASGDDNRTDGDVENFMSTDVDRFDSIIFFETYTDDNAFTEAPHILDKGLFFNKLALDYKHSDKLTLGGAVLYLQTAENLTLGGGKTSKELGTEIDAYLSYKLYANTELAINAGYLFADDGMDAFERTAQQDGKSDTDVFRSTARVRYSF